MEICAFCGEEVLEGGFTLYEHIFCSEECLEAYREEALDLLEDEEFDV